MIDENKIKRYKIKTFLISILTGCMIGSFVTVIEYFQSYSAVPILWFLFALIASVIGYMLQLPKIRFFKNQKIEIYDEFIICSNDRDTEDNSLKDIKLCWEKVIAIDCKPVKLFRRNEMLRIQTENNAIIIEDIFKNYMSMKRTLLALCEKHPNIEIDKKAYKTM